MRIRSLLFVVLACFILSGCGGGFLQSTSPSTPLAPSAGFTFSPASPTTAQAVTFTDTSTGSPTGWSWNFGDGSTSTSQSPSHTFTSTGTFTVTLTASNSGGSNAASHSVTVTAAGSTPTASFTFSPVSPTTAQAVTFTDTSTGNPTGWSWNFGDGSTSISQNPSHTFASAGTYTITLTASNAAGSKSSSQSITVTAAGNSGMTASFAVVTNGQVATFTDTSSGSPKVWSWSFGDGTTSAIENPVNTYLTAGTYTVTLTVSNSAGTSSSTVTQSVTVNASAPLTAFNFARAANNTTIAFTDATIGVPTSWSWDFGDGSTSAQQSPSHIYAASGQYTVKLMAGNTAGSNQASHTIYVSPLSNLLESLVPAGSFAMGDHFGFVDPTHPSDEIPVHTVNIDAMYVSTTPTTNEQYVAYLNDAMANGLITVTNNVVYDTSGTTIYCYLFNYQYSAGHDSTAYSIAYNATTKVFSVQDFRANHPMVGVTWNGAAAYSNWLSTQAGLTPCYNLTTWVCDFSKNGYRLPTEAEWEYAGRGGQTTPYYNFPWGDDQDLEKTNWPSSGDPYEGTDQSTYPWTTPVGFYNGTLRQKSTYNWPGSTATYQTHNGANGFGLFDMAGNVWQFVYDWYDAGYYSLSPTDNPTGPASGQLQSDGLAYRGMRGGSWYNGDTEAGVNDGHSRVSNRCPASPTYFAVPQLAYSTNVGFRLVRNAAAANLVAGFTYGPAAPTTGQTIAFADASSGGAATWSWSFGDGTTSTIEDPSHIYATSGNYTITLTTGNATGFSTVTKTVSVTTSSPIAPGFTFAPIAPLAGQVVIFTDTSTGGATTWSWDFGDSAGKSPLQNPVHAYAAAGTYAVTLTVANAIGSQTVSHNVVVASTASSLVASYTYSLSSRAATFTDTSTGSPTGWSWSFGDGTTSSTKNPSDTYSADGIFAATLTITGASGTSTFSQSVIVNSSVSTRTVGLMLNTSKAFQGYTLFSPKQNTMTYLIDNEGRIVHEWTASKYAPGQSSYLLENGHLLRPCFNQTVTPTPNTGGGEGGRIEEFDWDGNLVWELNWATSTYMQHHDIKRLPNGNILMLVVEKKSYAEAIAAGFNPSMFQPQIVTDQAILPDSVVEIQPTGTSGGNVVWEWHVWDHLIQSYDATKANYGTPSAHPELIDAAGNHTALPEFWNHMNSIDYDPVNDEIALSVRGNSEVWVIDHSTTSAQAAGHTGGARGKGGDLLYRWGDPIAYGAGIASNQLYYQQHDVEWIRPNSPGAGHFMCYNNGLGRGTTNASSINEFIPAVDGSGNYSLVAGTVNPTGFNWSYNADAANPMYSADISGAQRLPNGNTIICTGGTGEFREVSYSGEIVWKYINPVAHDGPVAQGAQPPADPNVSGETLNSVFRVYKYPLDYPAFIGKTLTPGNFIVE